MVDTVIVCKISRSGELGLASYFMHENACRFNLQAESMSNAVRVRLPATF